MEAVDQTYFINVDDYYTIEDAIVDEHKGFGNLIRFSCTVLDDNWKSLSFPGLEEFSSRAEWKKFKLNLINKFNNVEKYILLYIKRYKEISEESMDEDEAKEWWNNTEEDMYPRDSFDTFKDWYESNSYYEWQSDNTSISIKDFEEQNTDISEALKKMDSDDYIEKYSGKVYSHRIQKYLTSIENRITELFAEIDADISNKLNDRSNRLDAIQYIFEY